MWDVVTCSVTVVYPPSGRTCCLQNKLCCVMSLNTVWNSKSPIVHLLGLLLCLSWFQRTCGPYLATQRCSQKLWSPTCLVQWRISCELGDDTSSPGMWCCRHFMIPGSHRSRSCELEAGQELCAAPRQTENPPLTMLKYRLKITGSYLAQEHLSIQLVPYEAVNRNKVSIRQLPLFYFSFTHYMFRPLRAILKWDIQLDVFKDYSYYNGSVVHKNKKGTVDVLKLCCDWRHHKESVRESTMFLVRYELKVTYWNFVAIDGIIRNQLYIHNLTYAYIRTSTRGPQYMLSNLV
jgi:hypothetical protein